MSRLIDADELKEIAHEMVHEDPEAFNGGYSYNAVTVDEIDEAPTIEAVPVVESEWEICEKENAFDTLGNPVKYVICKNCDFRWMNVNTAKRHFKHCPNCGAKMKGGSE